VKGLWHITFNTRYGGEGERGASMWGLTTGSRWFVILNCVAPDEAMKNLARM